MVNTKKLLMLIALTALLSTAMIIFSRSNINARPQEAILPDAFMQNVSAVILDKSGKVSMKIDTPRMIHYAEHDTTHFEAPHIAMYHHSPNPWLIDAKNAVARDGLETVVFHEDVSIHHPAEYSNPATMIKTNSLTVHPNTKTAETDDFITMTQPNTIIKGIGMFADLDAGDIKLLSEAKGEYTPDA